MSLRSKFVLSHSLLTLHVGLTTVQRYRAACDNFESYLLKLDILTRPTIYEGIM